MSCQQVSRIISTATTTTPRSIPIVIAASATKTLSAAARAATAVAVAVEDEDQDPYAFTESVPTTPPILFNAQKSRSRHIDSATAAVVISTADVLPTTTNLTTTTQNYINEPFKQLNDKHADVTATTTTTTAAVTTIKSTSPATILSGTTKPTPKTVINCNSVTWIGKNATVQKRKQVQRQVIKSTATTNTSSTTTTTKNVLCTTPSSPPPSPPTDLQQSKAILPTGCLQLTPSLWQTPLLLDTNCTSKMSDANSPLHSPIATLPSPPAIMTNIATLHPQLLPPSNFHHTTLAQHLHKVEWIKKPKKSQIQIQRQTQLPLQTPAHTNSQLHTSLLDVTLATTQKVITPPATPPTSAAGASPPSGLPPLQAIELQQTTFNEPTQQKRQNQQQQQQQQQQQHSDSDLNEIPVNVIFRKPQPTPTVLHELNPKTCVNSTMSTITVTALNTTAAPPTTTTNTTTTTVSNTTSTTATTTTIKIIPTTTNTIKPITTCALTVSTPPALAAYRLMPVECQTYTSKSTVNEVPTQRFTMHTTPTMLKQQMSSNNMQQLEQQPLPSALTQQKEYGNPYINSNQTLPALNAFVRSKSQTTTNTHSSVTNNVKLNSIESKWASPVAIVKVSAKEYNSDSSLLAKTTVLPYCLQEHWLDGVKMTSNKKNFISNVKGREERIAQSKNLLQRQALQLLNSRSLQRLSLNFAKKRLLSIDHLLRKYSDHKGADIANK